MTNFITPPEKMQFNDDINKAINIINNTNKNLLLIGPGGVSKSTIIQHTSRNINKEYAILCPTGVSARNIGGETIHSFFKFSHGITPEEVHYSGSKLEEILVCLEILYIDEISMVQSYLLDCIDKSLRIHRRNNLPFGGVQVVLSGDIFQLSPVVKNQERQYVKDNYDSEWFFDAKVFKYQQFKYETILLKKIYRQSDEKWLSLLNKIRKGTVTNDEMNEINNRIYVPIPSDKLIISLTSTNQLSDEINDRNLKQLSTKLYTFKGEIENKFSPTDLPTLMNLELKEGAQVMCLVNKQNEGYVNGSIGEIKKIDEQFGIIDVKLDTGEVVNVERYTWENIETIYNRETKKLEKKVIGSFKQFPLKCCWSITIHKSQSKSFDDVIIDIGRGCFAHGQLYTCLSRSRTLEGIYLRSYLYKKHIIIDKNVKKFDKFIEQKNKEASK